MSRKIRKFLTLLLSVYVLIAVPGAALLATAENESKPWMVGAVLLLGTGWIHGDDAHFVWQAARYRFRNPEKEAARAVAADDLRLIAVNGLFPFVPSSHKLPAPSRQEIREVCGSGDTPSGSSAMAQSACFDFAQKFNDIVGKARKERGASVPAGSESSLDR